PRAAGGPPPTRVWSRRVSPAAFARCYGRCLASAKRPVPSRCVRRRRRPVGALIGGATALRGPERLDLGEDPLPELVAGTGEREGGVRVQTLQPACPGLAADPTRKLRPETTLLVVRRLDTRAQLRVVLREPAPALDAPGRLEPGDGLDEMRTGQVVAGRERLARLVERLLLGDGRAAVRAADGDPPERSRRSA